jgi:hypothetical protein
MKLNQVHSVEARALARQLADGADGSAAAGRMWKGLIRDLSAAAQAEREEASRVWFAADPDKRRFLPKDCGPCSIAFRQLGEAICGALPVFSDSQTRNRGIREGQMAGRLRVSDERTTPPCV